MRVVAVSLLVLAAGTGLFTAGHANAQDTHAQAVRLANDRMEVLINLTGGLPGRWVACARDCVLDSGVRTMAFLRASRGGGRLEWQVDGDPEAAKALGDLGYTASTDPGADNAVVILTSSETWRGMRLVHRYRLDPASHTLAVSLQMPPGASLRLTAGEDLRPESLPGFGGYYTRVQAVTLNADDQTVLVDDGEVVMPAVPLQADEWAGLRSRFWAFLVRPASATRLVARSVAGERPEIDLGEASASGRIADFTVYAGPVENSTLEAAGQELRNLLYPALWDWLRAMSFGLLWILEGLVRLVGNPGVAILLLSLAVKLLMSPLTWLAERWQEDVNRTQSLLQPELDAIRREYRGEEAHERTLAVYRRHGVSPFHTVRSLGGFLIQIPVFIAAFDMLGENFGLAGAQFLWIDDLSLPDRLALLPVPLPFFGGHLNLLPVLMTLLTLVAAALQEDGSLTRTLQASQRFRLYGMALVFFVLLYTFPAGMVLYWTANNFWHVVRIVIGRFAWPLTGRA